MHASTPPASGPADQPGNAARSDRVAPAAWLAWGLVAGCYLMAMFHRMALGVAALDAEDRFHVGGGAIAVLSVAGLGAYLAGQVPAGLLSDRIGSRRGLLLGLAIMATGEALFAVSTALAPAAAGRALVGAGDAFIFLNALRIVGQWFPASRFAQMTAITATVGAVGQLVGTVPLHLALSGPGWEATFWGSSVLTLALALAIGTLLRERPPGQAAPPRSAHAPVLASLRRSWSHPTTRDGFWVHFTAMAPFVVVTGVWGLPILVDAQGMTRGSASAILLIAVAVSAVAALLVGAYVRRRAHHSHRVAQQITAACIVALAVLTFVPATAIPAAVTAVCISVLGVGMGAGMLGFGIARRPDEPHDAASISALVNLGGFSMAILGDALVAAARSLLGTGSGLVLLPVLLIASFGWWRMSRRTPWLRPAPASAPRPVAAPVT